MEEKINELRNGHEVLVSGKDSRTFVERCVSSGMKPRCTGAVTMLGAVLVSFVRA